MLTTVSNLVIKKMKTKWFIFGKLFCKYVSPPIMSCGEVKGRAWLICLNIDTSGGRSVCFILSEWKIDSIYLCKNKISMGCIPTKYPPA